MKVVSTRSDEQLSRIMRIVVWWFKVIGLAPFSLEQIKKCAKNSHRNYCTSVFLFSKAGLAYNFILVTAVLTSSFFAIPQMLQKGVYPNQTSLTQAIDMMQGVLRTSTICVIVILWSLRQKNAASIMNRLLEIDCLLSGMRNYPCSEKSPFVSLSVQIILDLVLWVIFWATEAAYIYSVLDIVIFNVPIFIMHWFVVEYFIVVGLVARKLDSLNDDLASFRESPNIPTCEPTSVECPAVRQSSPDNYQLSALKLLHSIRTTLSEVAQDVATFFSLPILPVVACFSLTLIYNLHYLITPLVVPTDEIPIAIGLNVAAWILVSVYPLVLLGSNVTETLKAAKRTGPLVHKLLATVKSPEIQTQLERFSLELIHEDLSFTAHGFFSLDFTLIQSIFGATVTYLVIIFQFIQSAASTSKNN